MWLPATVGRRLARPGSPVPLWKLRGWGLLEGGQCQLILEDFRSQRGDSQRKGGLSYQKVLGRYLPSRGTRRAEWRGSPLLRRGALCSQPLLTASPCRSVQGGSVSLWSQEVGRSFLGRLLRWKSPEVLVPGARDSLPAPDRDLVALQ